MIKRIINVIIIFIIVSTLYGCNNTSQDINSNTTSNNIGYSEIHSGEIKSTVSDNLQIENITNDTDDLTTKISDNAVTENEEVDSIKENKEQVSNTMVVEVNGQEFTAQLYDNETVTALKNLLPMNIVMNELNGNEKYKYIETALPTNNEKMGTIQAGDIMLYGSDCLVIFYETFSSSYSYTKIGHIDNVDRFVNTLSSGSVTISFRK